MPVDCCTEYSCLVVPAQTGPTGEVLKTSGKLQTSTFVRLMFLYKHLLQTCPQEVEVAV